MDWRARASIGGVIVDGGNYRWNNGKFPQFTESQVGIPRIEILGCIWRGQSAGAYPILHSLSARVEGLRDFGPALSPFNSFLLLQGTGDTVTPGSTGRRQCLVACQMARRTPHVETVNYPGLTSGTYHALAKEIPA